MEYQRITNLLDDTLNQPSKFRTKKWVGINDDARGKYNTNNQTKSTTSMLKSNLFYYSDVYIFVRGTVSVEQVQATAAQDNDGKKLYLKLSSAYWLRKWNRQYANR